MDLAHMRAIAHQIPDLYAKFIVTSSVWNTRRLDEIGCVGQKGIRPQ